VALITADGMKRNWGLLHWASSMKEGGGVR